MDANTKIFEVKNYFEDFNLIVWDICIALLGLGI